MSKPAESGKPARGPRTYRILTLGDGAVGKTSLLRFYRGDKTPVVSTIGIDMVLADAVVRGRSMKLQIWDTAGQERFRSIVVSYLRNCHGVLVCYDVTRRATFLSVRSWLDALISLEPHAVAVLCACKADVGASEREVAAAEGSELARRLGVPFFESSAKTGANVREAFHALAEELAARHEVGLEGATGSQAVGAGSAARSLGHPSAHRDNLADRLRRLDSETSAADGPARGAPFKVIDDTASAGTAAVASRQCAC